MVVFLQPKLFFHQFITHTYIARIHNYMFLPVWTLSSIYCGYLFRNAISGQICYAFWLKFDLYFESSWVGMASSCFSWQVSVTFTWLKTVKIDLDSIRFDQIFYFESVFLWFHFLSLCYKNVTRAIVKYANLRWLFSVN